MAGTQEYMLKQRAKDLKNATEAQKKDILKDMQNLHNTYAEDMRKHGQQNSIKPLGDYTK